MSKYFKNEELDKLTGEFFEKEENEIKQEGGSILEDWDLVEFDENKNNQVVYFIEYKDRSLEMRFYDVDYVNETITKHCMNFQPYNLEMDFNSFEEFTDYCFNNYTVEYDEKDVYSFDSLRNEM